MQLLIYQVILQILLIFREDHPMIKKENQLDLKQKYLVNLI